MSESYRRIEEIDTDYFKGEVEIVEDPSRKELMDMLREYGGLRGVMTEDGTVTLWRGDVLHANIDAYGDSVEIEAGVVRIGSDDPQIAEWVNRHPRLRRLLQGFNILGRDADADIL